MSVARHALQRPRAARPERRLEIDGLRAVAVLLVVIYHIWPRRVSGGVDVFLMLTGFLITGSLLRNEHVKLWAFIRRLLRRLLPAAGLTLFGVLIGMVLILPKTRWDVTVAEVVASALYYENWQLAFSAVDYLSAGNAVSPVQHFWSLAIQGQFYVIWPVLLLMARRKLQVFVGLMAAVFVLSLAYSILRTATDQAWAYFDTGARLWELALGGLLAVALPFLKVPRPVRVVLGWLGLAALVACGLVLQVSTSFPGYVALWPTLAAAAVIVAGAAGGADRLLTLRPVLYVGRVSYALYLWHWPIFVFYLVATDRTAASWKGILLILAASFALAAVTTELTDRTGGWGPLLLAPALVGAVVVTFLPRQDSGITPAPALAAKDRPRSYEDGCAQHPKDAEVLVCRYGAKNPDKTIALVGNSHAAHWLPVLELLGEDNGWQIVNITKGACALSTTVQLYRGKPQPTCDQWQEGVLAELRTIGPDLLITTATESSEWERGENMPGGYLERWRQLGAMGIDVLAIRDTPRMGFDPPECVETKGAAACVAPRSLSLAERMPTAGPIPDNVTVADFNATFCPDDRCPSVIGDTLVYSDNGHITATFVRSLAPALEKEVLRALAGRQAKSQG
ncbi:acyltransferase family protein [Planomonospora venezuelensis]|uniref:Peptidoglycan/LPS O-acetylase OafA/YrhL n=1 Tax=Planomonospora venezuelensis TaxID=1999 RepID=A0A841CYX1_PLAVE|nr:acyltransferase family protein [Planomonospora venezuelensis]MBB5961308.1 peptidoglycan/LPS O-acetylase OafA/YrhL [Planomonospora venezuelensis]